MRSSGSRTVLVLLTVLVVAAPLATPLAGGSSVSISPDERRHRVPFTVSVHAAPDPSGGPGMVVQGLPADLWVHVTWSREDRLNTTLHLETPNAEDVVLNRTRVPVDVASHGTATFPLHVTNATGARVLLHVTAANTMGPDGEPWDASASIPVVPPVSVRLEAVAPERRGGQVHAGMDESVRIRATVSNPTSLDAPPTNLSLHSRGSRSPQGLHSAPVPALAPGASRTFDIGPIGVEDLTGESPRMGRGGFHGTLHTELEARISHGGTARTAYGFALEGSRVLHPEPARLSLMVHDQPASYVTGQHLEVGEPSHLELTVGNFGDTAQTVVVDLTVRPDPAIYYGPGSFFEETRVLRLDAGERRTLNFTFTPRVAGAMQVETQTSFQGHRSPNEQRLDIPTAIRIDTDAATLQPGVGETVDWTFNLTALEDLGEVEVRFATAPQAYRASQGVSFVRFITGDDLVTVEGSPGTVTLDEGDTVQVETQVTAKAAGSYQLVPYVVKDGVVYPPAISGGRTVGGEQSVRVLAEAELPHVSIPWLPVGLVLVGAVGQVVWRTRFVR